MRSYHVAVLPGDGIGPEVMLAALQVVEKVLKKYSGPQVEFRSHEAGAGVYARTGITLPEEVYNACVAADAVLLAAIGLPTVRKPDGTEVQAEMMMKLRRGMKLHSAIRPVKLYPGVESVLRDSGAGIDMIILRENLEGLFASYGGGGIVGDEVATDTLVITRRGTEDVVKTAFQLAAGRNGRPSDGRPHVTCVDKANVFRSFAFFRKVFHDVAAGYPDIATDAVYVDAMSLYLVQNPEDFDVLVCENQFGDILSDLGAGLVGGLGMAPSAEIGDEHGMFQPSHGTAPQLAGKNVANPIAMILSAAMMFDWLGKRHGDAEAIKIGRKIEEGVARMLAEKDCRTPDLGGSNKTTEVTQAVIEAL
ncbi:MAG: isocitrate/isopropylmalate family dehydrogenase [Planctomycetales bacterium]